MKRKLLVEYQHSPERCRWLVGPIAEGQESKPGEGSLDDCLAGVKALREDPQYASAEIIIAINSSAVSLRRVQFAAAERRHILKTVAYELEETLVSDLERLHIACGTPGNESLQVAVVEKELLANLLEQFQHHDLEPTAIVSLASLIGSESGEWNVVAGDEILTSSGSGQSFTTSLSQGRMAWNAVARAADDLPPAIRIFHADEYSGNQAMDSLPPAMAAIASLEKKPWYEVFDWSRLSKAVPNLLQGDFSPSVAWAQVWYYWRLPAAVLVAGLFVFTLGAFLTNQRLENENVELRQEMARIYQDNFPGSPVRDPEAQMRSKLKALGSASMESEFLPLLYQSAQTLESFEGVKLLTANFDARNNELRVDLIAQKFEDIEKIQTRMQKSGIVADLVNSSSVEGGERARIKLKNKGSV